MSESTNTSINQAVAEGGAYEVIKRRLSDYGNQLKANTDTLNRARLEEFGSSDMSVLARIRVRTEHNCIPRDMVQVGDNLLFGYNVFIGLKTETKISDVFSLFSVTSNAESSDATEISLENTFLTEDQFSKDFNELYRYYKHTKLVQLEVKDGKLLAAFQIGERLEDIRVFRWSLSADGNTVKYIDNRGEKDIQPPPAYDFTWTKVGRDQVVNGKHPHINILDSIFVETVGGDLTIKVENNTDTGLGVYSEPVEVPTQSIDDGEYHYVKLGDLIVLKILPYQEQTWRYLIFNTLTEQVKRIDAIGSSCVQLPEDHGIVFPGGYYLQSGQFKTFDEESRSLRFQKVIRSPNGEDVLYVFYDAEKGITGLFSYNLISKTLQNPIYGDGFALSEDGTLVIFDAVEEPTRVHPMQVWQTPFFGDEHASKAPEKQTFLGRIGNPELVRGISDIYSIYKNIEQQTVSVRLYEDLQKSALKVFDDHYWVGEDETNAIKALLKDIANTAELAIDEFEKVNSIRQQSALALKETQTKYSSLQTTIRTAVWETATDYIEILDNIRHQRGAIATAKELRYIDIDALSTIDSDLLECQATVSEKTVAFLADEKSLAPYYQITTALNQSVDNVTTVSELTPTLEEIGKNTHGLDLLSDLLTTIKIDDATVRTRIIDGISEVYAKFNQIKARANHKKKDLGSTEAVAQFSAQFKLFSQSITNALGLAHDPEQCDEQMSRLLVQLEELESQFSEYDEFLNDIIAKREEIYETFESHKQNLLDTQQRKAQNIADASSRMLNSIERRSLTFSTADALNTYFASDSLVAKVREFAIQLQNLDATVKADDIEAKLKSVRDQSVRALRDKSELYEGDGKIIKLGPKHKFSVNTQELDLTIIPRNGELQLHLSGTNFYQTIVNDTLIKLKPYWNITLESESEHVYRSEYLAISIYRDSQNAKDGLSTESLKTALRSDEALLSLVRDYSTPRYKDGYEKGIHDHDASLILKALVPAIESADLLIFDPMSRGFAQIFWANIHQISTQLKKMRLSFETWQERAQSASHMHSIFASSQAADLLAGEIHTAMLEFIELHPIHIGKQYLRNAADYLVKELGRENPGFIISKYGQLLADELHRSLDDSTWRRYRQALEKMLGWPAERWHLSCAWLNALIDEKSLQHLSHYVPEAAALINSDQRIDRRNTEVDLEIKVTGLLGDHTLVNNQELQFSLDKFMERMDHHINEFIPNYHEYLQTRQEILSEQKESLHLEEFKPRPLTSFVRNRLINESYLPIVGDNLAKQMGTVGESKRSDLMGLLMMISPPGYGKTTLMEYIASKLGLIFMKINCPSLGHEVLSLDPSCAPNATSKQELHKLNLALEMGNNVMLYLDDIQHTHPEFLQKFISLCDGTRRIEGIWQGKTKTYDMRGRKFCVVMAGNPYTESGEQFKIPDMLANRADIYNLGDILGGMNEQFEMSYIENSLTSNPALAQLATREMSDVYNFIKMAQGEAVPTTNLKHQYSGAEINEITEVLKKMFVVRDTLLKINQQYIKSAAQDDRYRIEPAFKLQGSYRNMNKMTEKLSAIMNDTELNQLIDDHYLGEAQLLTTGAEENLLKLAELRNVMDDKQAQRWTQIKTDFEKNKTMGGADTDTGSKIVGQLHDVVMAIQSLSGLYTKNTTAQENRKNLGNPELILSEATASAIGDALTNFSKCVQPNVNVVNEPVPGLDTLLATLTHSIEHSLYPIVKTMDKKLEIDLRTHYKMKEVSKQLMDIELKIQNELNYQREVPSKKSSNKPSKEK